MSETETPPEPAEQRELLRHFLAALSYRTRKALDGAPPDFGGFAPGEGVRTPEEIVRHMTRLLSFALKALDGEAATAFDSPRDLAEGMERFQGALRRLSRHLAAGPPIERETALRLLQGPLADAMTHAGQLAMLRRLGGSPVPPENFFEAEIRTKSVGRGGS